MHSPSSTQPIDSSPAPTSRNAARLTESGLWSALAELEALQEEGRWAEANAIARVLLARWPDLPVVVVVVARLHARQGRREQAFDLLLSGTVGKSARILNYRVCSRLAMSA